MNAYLFIIIATLLFGLGISLWGWRIRQQSQRRSQWPQAAGRIEESAPGAEQNDLLPHILYAYQVDGRDYRQVFQFPSGTHPLPEFTQSYLDKYPVGAPVRVYYDPQAPQHSTLEPSTQGDWLILLLGMLMVLGSVVALVVSL